MAAKATSPQINPTQKLIEQTEELLRHTYEELAHFAESNRRARRFVDEAHAKMALMPALVGNRILKI